MRTIRAMLGNDEKVWVYFDSKETCEQFLNMAVAEGFHFGELPVEKWCFGHVIAVHSNGDMGHLSLLVWCLSFSQKAEDCLRKADFKKYIEGYEDYLCRDAHFSAHIFSDHR